MPQPHKKITEHPIWFYSNVILRVLYSILLIGVSFLIIGGSFAAGIGIGYFNYLVEDTAIPSKKQLQKDLGDMTQTSHLAYNDNSAFATIRSDLLRTNISNDEISPLIKTAIIATEDEHFYEHKGIVPKAVIRALASEVTGFGSSGGSTLTQQLVKQQILTNETTFSRKANEIILATEVEEAFTKDEIITMYLNVSPFGRNNQGQNIAGVQEAALGIFGVNASEVNLPQAAFIAGLPQSPIVYTPYSNLGTVKEEENLAYGLKRKDFVLFSMYRNHDISKEEYEEALAYDLVSDFIPPETLEKENQNFLYYAVMGQATEIVAKRLAEENKVSEEDFEDPEIQEIYFERANQELANGGYTVQSTIDRTIYNAMQQAVANYGSYLDNWAGATIEVGNVLMENKTGRILGFVGGRDYDKNPYNHALSSKRQAGSAIKPFFIYAPAIDQGLIGTETRVSDYPTNYLTSWQGQDSGTPIVNALNTGSRTFQTIRESIIRSDNIPASNIYQHTLNSMGSADAIYEQYLKKMNFPDDPVWQYPASPLGVAEITTLEQTNGFQTLANNGIYQEGYLIESIIDANGEVYYQHEANPVQVFSKAAASITVDLMRSVLTDAFTTDIKSRMSALNWNLGNADWVGKTGTTDENVDSWLVLSTPNVTLSSWSGREDSKPSDIYGGQRTANYMANLANAIYQAKPEIIGVNDKFQLDPSVMQADVSKFTGVKPGGSVIVNNTTITPPSDTVTSYWAKNGPSELDFRFGIGGTDSDYADYWKKVAPKPKPKDKPKSKDKDKNKDKDKDKEEDKDKDKDEKEDEDAKDSE